MGPQEDYIETVFTCEGDYDDPHLQDRLEDFKKSLKDLLLTDKSKLILKKVEPWNSVRVTFNIPREAAIRLKQLAQQGNTQLKDLGVLAVQIQDQHISLTIAGRNNEHAQLVFRTAETSMANMPIVSVVETTSTSLEGRGPQTPWPNYIETSKNIADYLRQGLDSLLHPSGDKNFQTGVAGNVHHDKRNNVIPASVELGTGKYKPFQQPTLPTSHHGNPTRSSPSLNATSPRRSPVGQTGLEFPHLPGLAPGLPPGLPPGPRHLLDNLPPPPPYPQGSSIVNNLQKLRYATDTNPLLVNLLHQHDPNLSNFLQAGLLPPGLDTDALPQPQKKKRKPRKPKEKKKIVEMEIPVTTSKVGFNPVVSIPVPTTLPYSTVTVQSSMISTSLPNQDVVTNAKEYSVQNYSRALHNIPVQNKPEPLLSVTGPGGGRKAEESDTAGKIINPVTGLLEPMDSLSDTSPTKSESGKNSPRSLAQKIYNTSEVVSTSQSKVDSMLSHQGMHAGLYPSIQRTLSEHSIAVSPEALSAPLKAYTSSQSSVSVSSDLLLHHKQFPENFKADLMARSEVKNDIMPPYSKLEQKICDVLVGQPRSEESKCDKVSAPSVATAKVEHGTVVGLPQESYVKSIPPQLLNKPLLQVKHTNSTGGKPSGSPDSNGDSECSSQSINLDTQNGADLGSQASQPLDPRSYNNDSGVGSSSERSDDTPSEPGDSDFKSGNASSFECAKKPIVDPLKQTPPTSKVVTVGFAINETHKNHKIVSPFMSSEKIVNSKLDLTKLKSDKTDLCSSQLHGLPWTSDDDQIRRTNIVDSYVKQVVQDSINRKSPKSSVGFNARIPVTDGQINSMQGIHEQTMQKKKSSPRNSPRGSPRNPSSPRNANSPRGGGSPRSTDAVISGTSRQPFLTAQDFATHLPHRESHNKSPYSDPGKSPHGDPRKSPFNFLLTSHTSSAPGSKTNAGITHIISGDLRHDLQNSVGLDALRLSHQCNIDNLALLKSLEAAHGSIPGKEASILQKFEELRPYFQKLQQQAAQAAATVPVRNGTEVLNHLSRSPGPMGPLNKLCPPPSIDDIHNAFDLTIPNNLHPSVTTSTSVDRDSSIANCVNSKGNKEEQKGANNSSGSRKSPGAATSNSASSYPNDSSLLPPPKRLTESVQKLFPNPLDNTLPHNIMNRRSPISSASVTRVSNTTNGSVSLASSRGSLPAVSVKSSGNKTPVNELDLDSIMPSISGFGFGPTDLQVDTSLKSQIGMSLPDTVTMPKLIMMDSNSTNLSHQSIVSTSAVKVVPAVTGSITSHKAYAGDVPKSSSMHLSHLVSSKSSYSSSGCVRNISNTNSDTNMSVCNSDSKMASVRVSTADGNFKSHGVSSTFGPPILHPQSVKYPKNVEMPTSPYQQMGLSEMLQETANLQSIAGTQAASPVSNISSSSKVSEHLTVKKVSDQDKKIISPASFVERIQQAISTQIGENNAVRETKHSKDVSLCDSHDNLQDMVQMENSDIPTLKCQVDIENKDGNLKISLNHTSKNPKNEPEENLQNDSDLIETSGRFTNKDPSPPILTAVTNVSISYKENNSEESDKYSSHLDEEKLKNMSSSSAILDPKVQDSRAIVCDSGTHISLTETQSSNLSTFNDQDGQLVECVNNSCGNECENPNLSLRPSKLRKRRGSSESIEEKSEEPDVAPRQLRSRKRTNTGDNENSNDDSKRLKLDLNLEVAAGNKIETLKDSKTPHSVKTIHSSVTSALETKSGDESNTQESQNVKSGLRTRTNLKSVVEEKDKGKPPTGREIRKDGKVISNKAIPERKTEQSKMEDVKRIQQSRRNRQSPSAPADKLVTHTAPREKSPLRTSRSRGHSSPVVMEGSEEAQENKRTTRSARSKAEPVAQTSTKNMLVNKRRRTSQDHR